MGAGFVPRTSPIGGNPSGIPLKSLLSSPGCRLGGVLLRCPREPLETCGGAEPILLTRPVELRRCPIGIHLHPADGIGYLASSLLGGCGHEHLDRLRDTFELEPPVER